MIFGVANDCPNDHMWEFTQVSGPRGKYANEQKRKLPLREETMAEIKLSLFVYGNNFDLCGCAGGAATGGNRRSHHFKHVKEILLLADSNYITWAPSISCCLLSRLPVSR